jgi:hypothetical protein
MGVFIPKHMTTPVRPPTHHHCRWCGAWRHKKTLYKLRDGPVDWWFCNDDHALDWLEHRHKTPAINAMLHRPPYERDLDGKCIATWVRDELSHVPAG